MLEPTEASPSCQLLLPFRTGAVGLGSQPGRDHKLIEGGLTMSVTREVQCNQAWIELRDWGGQGLDLDKLSELAGLQRVKLGFGGEL